ncbi:thymidylate synthase [Robbsia sp. Bb-Pol-6]|uniref:Thymidylate synthase n=1 Tax=Robbsia betulipollinis TaxID=2981849 RepID=A0ABT3ZPZ1_9BURK|nr:thymidylate synthase [Robbsia betulipollinis]MCY0388609.1 thymidylate synthase [Robbsia betulipollinis]
MDQQYLAVLRRLLEQGTIREDRTGTGTRSLFGVMYRHDLAQGFPLLTTKKLHIRSILHELLWFLRGETNLRYLHENKVTIWDEWATPDGELGPVYGAQWRHWRNADGTTTDQIAALVASLRDKPFSRRHIINAWNVSYLPDEARSPVENAAAGRMALPPCHVMYQFYVADGRLSCMLTQRSGDWFLGVPYNCASVAFLTHMLAQQVGLEPGEIVHSIGDAHLYANHVEQAREQLSREPRALPRLLIRRRPASILDYRFDDFEILDYAPHPSIAAPIAI